MSFNDPIIIDLLDELDLDIQGFTEVQSELSSLFFTTEVYHPLPSAFTEVDEPFVPIDEVYMSPRKWVTAGPPPYDDVREPDEIEQVGRVFQTLTLQVPPRSPSPSPRSRRLPSPTTPTAFARLRAKGSNLALSALASPDLRHRILI